MPAHAHEFHKIHNYYYTHARSQTVVSRSHTLSGLQYKLTPLGEGLGGVFYSFNKAVIFNCKSNRDTGTLPPVYDDLVDARC